MKHLNLRIPDKPVFVVGNCIIIRNQPYTLRVFLLVFLCTILCVSYGFEINLWLLSLIFEHDIALDLTAFCMCMWAFALPHKLQDIFRWKIIQLG